MIKRTQDELSWSDRMRSWMNDIPAGNQGCKRKVLEQLHNKNKLSTRDCEVSSSKRRYLSGISKRMVDGIEDAADANQQIPNYRQGQSSFKSGSVRNRGRPRGSRSRRAGAGRGNTRSTVDHNEDKEDDSLATGKPTPNNPRIIQYVPMFLNVEIKKQHVAADPLVQLAVWIAAEFKKRMIEGYSRSMPVVAVTIEGHNWQLYVAYEPEFQSTELKRLVY